MDKGIVALFIPITICLGVFMMIWGLRYLENKENMAMIERGLNPGDKKGRRNNADPSRTLRNALMFMGAGLGLLLAIMITKMFNMNDESGTGVYFGLIALFGGLGMLGAYLYERKNPPTFPES
jgi:hypothetical protein